MSSVDEIYDQVVEEKVIDEMYADQDQVDEEEEFEKQVEQKFQFVEIPVDQIDRRTIWVDNEIYAGHKCPVLVYAGSLPMISMRDANWNIQKDVVMTSCVEFYDQTYQKIYEWLATYGNKVQKVEPLLQDEETVQEYEVPRAVMGLAKLVEDTRENLNEIWNPTMFTKKKKMRLLRDRTNKFLKTGADQVAIAIVQHINSLVRLGHYPQDMFGDYLKQSANVRNCIGEAKIIPLLDLVLCAEVVMPSQEELIPKKRIDTALPSAGAG
jgi:hypothetical protein